MEPNGRTIVLPCIASLVAKIKANTSTITVVESAFQEQFITYPRVTYYEVPMIGGLARLGKWFIDGGMRRGTPREDYEHVITVYGCTESWKQRSLRLESTVSS